MIAELRNCGSAKFRSYPIPQFCSDYALKLLPQLRRLAGVSANRRNPEP
jgi:hypothetical protein